MSAESRSRTPTVPSPNGAKTTTLVYKGVRFTVDAGGIKVGRGEGNDVLLDVEEASRRHAQIKQDAGEWRIQDLGSRNGTWVNGERIEASRALANGDSIYIGGELLRFLNQDTATQGATGPAPVTSTRSIRLSGDRLTIGRDKANDVALGDPSVSRFHGEISADGNVVEFRDLGSRNGSLINDEPTEATRLETGDEIRIGSYRLIFDGEAVLTRNERGVMGLDAYDVEMWVKGGTILKPTTLRIPPGRFVAIIGESGAGKTTLIKALAGVVRPSGGQVLVNGAPVDSHATDIGYVPQQEIVHDRLTIREALRYSARLRLPADTSAGEIEERLSRVVGELALEDRANLQIGRLSGGQRRRVGLGVELLGDPTLLFLDEPTTGLDPGLEARTMELFRDLSGTTRSVVIVTHATQSLTLCDRVIVMGRGGELCFYGPPADSLTFFGVDTYPDIYRKLPERESAEWAAQFQQGRETPVPKPTPNSERDQSKPSRRPRGLGPQLRVLLSRYARVFRRDRRNILILFGQAPLIGLALAGLFTPAVFSLAAAQPGDASQLLFLLVTMAIWLGLIDSAREVVKERAVFERESAIGVRVRAYLGSKLLLLSLIAAAQVAILVAVVLVLRPLHEEAAVYAGLAAALLLTALIAVSLGLLTSSFVASQDQATSFVPLLLVPQLLFAGAIIPVDQMSSAIASLSDLVFAKWSFALAGALVDMNSRIAADPEAAAADRYGSEFFGVEEATGFVVLAAFLVTFVCWSGITLKRRARARDL